ncbi:MAG: hypothetical protein ACLPPV_17920 [Candidatus Korobacteraceae bacterium]|jgi:hypothetical protein
MFVLVTILLGRAEAAMQSDSTVLTNQSVIEMVQDKLPEEVIVTKIQTSKTNFDVSTNGLVALNKAGVPTSVIKAMITSTGNAASGSAAATAKTGDPNDPLVDHDAGIYIYYKTSGGKRQLVELEPTVYTQGKSGGVFKSAMTYGIAKVKWKAVVRGPHAAIATTDPDAVFYFYFEEKGAGLSHSSFSTSTPNEFTLLRFDVKKEERETIVMQANVFGSESGSQDNATIQFTFSKLRPGVYKVTPNAPMHPGEYCFLSAQTGGAFAPGAAAANKVFDFGIIPAE